MLRKESEKLLQSKRNELNCNWIIRNALIAKYSILRKPPHIGGLDAILVGILCEKQQPFN